MIALPLLAAAVSQADQGSFWFPVQASRYAPEVDFLFDFILWISTAFFVVIIAVMAVFIIRYRRRAGVGPKKTPTHNTALELTWSILPGILLVVMFWMGAKAFIGLREPPDDSYEVGVTGQKWNWSFAYPNGHVDPELHVPVDTPVRLVLSSDDVIHSFFVPAFRIKQDAVPGRYTKLWFNAKETGTFQVFCAEYCGTKHSDMLTRVVVHEPGGFEKWLADASDFLAKLPPAEAGKKIYESHGCKACHTVDGTPGIGPSWKGVYAHQRSFTDGTSEVALENYLRQSIVEPEAKVVAGFGPVMPTFKGKLKDAEITAVIEFMKTLK